MKHVRLWRLRAVFRGFFGGLLLKPGATEHINHGVVALMTGVLVYFVRDRTESRLPGPSPGKRRGIVDREPVEDRLRANACEPLDHMQILSGSSESGLACKIGRVDNQRISLPMADRVPHPLPDIRWQVRAAVQWDDPWIVDLL